MVFCKKCGTYLTITNLFQENSPPIESKSTSVSNAPRPYPKTRYLPERHRSRLLEAHAQIALILRTERLSREETERFCVREPEPIETAFSVEELRWFWKPENVKFVLVAESHVYTDKEEVEAKIDPRKLRSIVPDFPEEMPLSFAKVVYCLGYGRPEILDHPEKIEFNPGTRQYVDLLRKCLAFPKPVQYSLRWKTSLLKAAKVNGLWLLDASCHACAFGQKKRLYKDNVNQIVPISWKTYVQPILDDLSVDPNRVWIIGGGLQKLLSGKYSSGSNWSYQPNVILGGPNKEKLQAEKKRRDLLLEKRAADCLKT